MLCWLLTRGFPNGKELAKMNILIQEESKGQRLGRLFGFNQKEGTDKANSQCSISF